MYFWSTFEVYSVFISSNKNTIFVALYFIYIINYYFGFRDVAIIPIIVS